MTPKFPSVSNPREMKMLCPHKKLHMTVYSSIVNNSQKMETTQMSISCWMDKQNVICIRTFFSDQKELSTDTCYSVDEPWRHHVKWKKPVTKDHIFHDCVYMKCPEEEIYGNREEISGFQEMREREIRRGCYRVQGFFWGDENVLKFILAVSQFWENTKNHWVVCFKWVNHVVCKLFLNKALK